FSVLPSGRCTSTLTGKPSLAIARASIVRAVLATLIVVSALAADPADAKDDLLMQALVEQLDTSKAKLANQSDAPLYYLSYRVNDGQWFVDTASYGAMEDDDVDDPM